jgi:hypothetical protein
MEVKRRYKEVNSVADSKIELNSWFRRNLFSITGIYYNLFGYGERLKRIALTTVLLFAVFSAAYYATTFVLPKPENKPSTNMHPFVNSTITTLSDMFQIKSSGLQPLEYVIRILSLPLIGIVIIALKRKFEKSDIKFKQLHFSDYGESIIKPTIIGAITVGLSTLFWLMQSIVNSSLYKSTSHFIYLNQAGNFTHWLTAFQRSLADFLPLLSLPSNIKIGVIDYIIKIVGGALTFGLLAIALRRKFERKYTR